MNTNLARQFGLVQDLPRKKKSAISDKRSTHLSITCFKRASRTVLLHSYAVNQSQRRGCVRLHAGGTATKIKWPDKLPKHDDNKEAHGERSTKCIPSLTTSIMNLFKAMPALLLYFSFSRSGKEHFTGFWWAFMRPKIPSHR